MLNLKWIFHRRKASLRSLACGLCALALAIFFASVSPPAVAQNQHDAAGVTSGEFKLAGHARVPAYPYYQPYYQPRYQPRYRPRYRPGYRSSYQPRPRPGQSTRRKRVKKTIPPAIWSPAGTSKDPVQIIISLPEQKISVYKGDKLLVSSRISSGKPGYSTPSGVFSILQKNRFHRSNIYSNAPMPFMQRLTWSGIALHGFTSVPSVPASAGCIRLPMAFASQLFQFTEKGAHVIVANEKTEPFEIRNDKLLQPSPRSLEAFASIEREEGAIRSDANTGKKRSTSPLRILITRRTDKGRIRIKEVQKLLNELTFEPGDADGYMGPDTAKSIRRFQATYGLKVNGLVYDKLIEKLYEIAEKDMPANGRLYVRQNFKPVFDAPVLIRDEKQPLGSHLFTAMYFEPGATDTRWTAVTLIKGSLPNKHALHGGNIRQPVKGVDQTAEALMRATAEAALDRIVIPAETRKRLADMLTPGSSIAISDDGISWETAPKGTDFIVLMQ